MTYRDPSNIHVTAGRLVGIVSIGDLVKQVLEDQPELPRGVPRELEAIALCCLEKDPGRRYPSAADLAAELGRFVGENRGDLGRIVEARRHRLDDGLDDGLVRDGGRSRRDDARRVLPIPGASSRLHQDGY